jgi:hypothetical protein
MSIHRAARAASALLLVACACLFAVPSAAAQDQTEVGLTLEAQTPFTSLQDPELRVIVSAHSDAGTAFNDLSVFITIGQAIRSRDQYEASLTQGPGLSPVVVRSFPQEGTLEPGGTRTFDVQLDVGAAGLDPGDSLVYPSQVDLRSGGTPIAALYTAVVNIVRTPERPMRMAWWAEVTAPPAFDPTGALVDPAFEAAVAPGGSLGAEIEALRQMVNDPTRGDPIDLVIEPAVVDQLTRMAAGFERADGSTVEAGRDGAANAAALLQSLREIAESPAVQVSGMPFAAPQIPSLLATGLTADLERQRVAGVAILDAALGVSGTTQVARPPDGALNEAAVDDLVRTGAGTILADATTVERPAQPNEFAPLPTASLSTPAGNSIQLVLPDPGTQALLSDPALLADPVRTAQAVFGELATIWRESPVPVAQPDDSETVRGVALTLPAGLPARIWGQITRRIADAPFLQTAFAQDFVEQVNPPGPPAALLNASSATFSPTYADGIRDERRAVEAYRSMLLEEDPTPAQLDTDLLYAEWGGYLGVLGEQAGRVWIDHAHEVTEGIFARVRPQTAEVFTFTSATGTIPLRMGDPGDTPLKIVVQLRSAWFRFPEGPTQIVTLTRPNQVVSFRVTATAGGQAHPIQLLVRAPSGRPLDQPKTLVVRTAAVSRVALVITVLAALGLAVLWARRLLRVRRFKRET